MTAAVPSPRAGAGEAASAHAASAATTPGTRRRMATTLPPARRPARGVYQRGMREEVSEHRQRRRTGAQLRVIRAAQPTRPAGFQRALRREPRTDAAPPLAREELLRQPLVDEVPGQHLVHARLAQREEVGIVR